MILNVYTRLAVGSNKKEPVFVRSLNEVVPNSFCTSNSPELDCSKVNVECLHCVYKENCVYGNTTSGNCSVPQGIICKVKQLVKLVPYKVF